MATTTKREILVLNRYAIKEDYAPLELHAGDVVLRIRNDKGVEYTTTLRRNKCHSCTCPSYKPCYHINQMVECENKRFAAEKAAEAPYIMSEALHAKLAEVATPKVVETPVVKPVAKVRKQGNKLVLTAKVAPVEKVVKLDYQSARTASFFGSLPSRKELAS